MKSFLTFLFPLLLLAAGCDDLPGGNAVDKKPATPAKPTTPATPTSPTTPIPPAPAVTNTVTGSWYYKKEIMKLTQSGASIQGTTALTVPFNNNPADPIEFPVPTVGSVAADGTIKITELVNHTLQPAKSFRVEKVGTLKSNTLTLNVIKGQAPHVQVWTRR